MMEEPVRVTIAPNEVAADVVCTFLRAEGILCNHRVTNIGAGSWDGARSGLGSGHGEELSAQQENGTRSQRSAHRISPIQLEAAPGGGRWGALLVLPRQPNSRP